MKIGNVEINGVVALAPMAGVCDKAYREICKNYGASYTIGEMASAKGICYNSEKSEELLMLSDKERPSAVQLFGNEPEFLKKASIVAMKYKPDIIDINMGCPAPKITKDKSGSALMLNPKLCGEIVSAVKSVVDIPVTVKIRKGWDDLNVNAVEVAKYCEDGGADAITVHGRTRMQFYSGKCDLDIIKSVKENVNIPVIANGDITDEKTAAYMYEYTNCDLIMVGRGAMGNPFIFSQITAWLKHGVLIPAPSLEEKLKVMIMHTKKLCENSINELNGVKQSRKHIAWYIKGLKGASGFRNEVGKVETIEDVTHLAYKIYELNKHTI